MKQDLIVSVHPLLRIRKEERDNKTFIYIEPSGDDRIAFVETDRWIVAKRLEDSE